MGWSVALSLHKINLSCLIQLIKINKLTRNNIYFEVRKNLKVSEKLITVLSFFNYKILAEKNWVKSKKVKASRQINKKP